jgi:lysosomal alpha-mannosidase
MGFDGYFFGRLDYQDLKQRYATKHMEMIWKGSANLGDYEYRYTMLKEEC